MELIHSLESWIRELTGSCSSFVLPQGNDRPENIPVPEGTECIITVGGDGTLVRTAYGTLGKNIPLLGVNMGHLGYLCDLDETTVHDAVGRLIRDDYELEERMMLEGVKLDSNRTAKEMDYISALNDVVIASANPMDLISLTVYINGASLYTYSCDGMIFSTPTGSTAYNLSAGGPIVDPKNQVILLTPLNPHTLNSRPIVLDAHDEIMVKLSPRHHDVEEEACVSFDGSLGFKIGREERIVIRRSKNVTRMVGLTRMNFLERISLKLQER